MSAEGEDASADKGALERALAPLADVRRGEGMSVLLMTLTMLLILAAYYLWLGIFNVMVIAQFRAFANDLYSQEQGKRLFPLIGIGSSLGAWLGSVRAGHLLTSSGPQRLLIGGAAILVACVFLSGVIDRVFCVRAGDVLQAGVVFAGEKAALAAPGFAAVNIVLVGAWLAVVGGLNANLRRPGGPCRGPSVVTTRAPRTTLSTRILIGLGLGLALGLFAGERTAALQVVADGYVKLLQMTVLPYVMVSIVGRPRRARTSSRPGRSGTRWARSSCCSGRWRSAPCCCFR